MGGESRHAGGGGRGRFEGDGEYRQVRGHHGRNDSAGIARRGGAGTVAQGRSGAAGSGGRGVYHRWAVDAVAVLRGSFWLLGVRSCPLIVICLFFGVNFFWTN